MKQGYKVPKYFEDKATQLEFCSLLRKGTDIIVIWLN